MPRGKKKKEAASGEGYSPQEPGQQQGQRGPQGGQEQQGQRGPQGGHDQQGQRGPQSGQQQQDQRGPQGGQQQRGQRGPQGGQEQQDQRGPQTGHQQPGRRGPQGGQEQQGQRGPQGGQEQQGQRGPQTGHQQQGRRGPQGGQEQQGQRGPQTGHQQQGRRGPQGGQEQQGQRGPQSGHQQQGQRGPQGGHQQQGQKGPEGPPPGQAKNPWNKGLPPGASPAPTASTGSAVSEVSAASAKPAWGTKPQSSDAKPASESQQKGKGREQREGASSRPDPVQQAPKQTPRRDGGGAKRPDKGGAQEVVSTLGGQGDIEKLAENMENMLIISPRRKINQNEKPGKRLMVETNHLPISLPKKKIIAYHYDVTFDPDKPKFLIRPAWNEFAARFFPGRSPSFDGKKNVYSNGPLPQVGEGSMMEEVIIRNHENDRDKTFKITIKIANKVDLSRVLNYVGASDERGPRDAMQAIDIILRNLPANQMVQSGRLFFSPPRGRIFSLGEGLDLWYGFHQSAILGWKPYLNVDIAHKGFPKPCSLLETLRDVCGWDGRSELDRYQSESFRKYIKKLKVEYKIPHLPSSKRVYKVNDIGEKASTLRFTLDNGTTTTVARYFETDKNYRLQYPFLPCLWVGSLAKKIYIPLELCTVVQGQVLNGKMSENQTAAMVREAAKGTDIRKQKIMEQIAQAQFNRSPYANEFEISVAGEFEKVEARILDPPKLQYGQDKTENPSRGVWRGTVFNKPAQLTGWCILCLDNRTKPDTLSNLENILFKTARELNMNPTNASRSCLKIDTRNLRNIFDDLKKENIRIVFVVVPDSGDTYSRVKKISELEVGILTQCLKASTVFRKLNQATVGNILLKVNAKLNGTNLALDKNTRPTCFSRPVMIVGADVTHPSPDSKNIPSVAAVAASHDPNGFQYNMVLRLQDPGDEMIRDLQNIMREQLLFFFHKTKFKPEKIIFYRDGVSDGQIDHIFNIEFQAIRRACASLSPDYQPKITFVIVQKRHHTRFFPNPNDRNIDDKRNYNVPAGTCVDTDIVHPRETDFYLVSHAAIQGTSRPTKYRLVWDDSDMGEIELQKLTYHLCHLFSRCTRSVSYPAPTYNAHLAAFRGRVYLEGETVNLTMLENEQRQRKIHDDIKSLAPMHFV